MVEHKMRNTGRLMRLLSIIALTIGFAVWFGNRNSLSIKIWSEGSKKPLQGEIPDCSVNKVPFYLYEGEGFDWLEKLDKIPEWVAKKSYMRTYKHGTELLFLERAKYHPWRVANPEDAKLFVIPWLSSSMVPLDNNVRKEYMDATGKALSRSTWFLRNGGRDHIIVSSHFNMRNNGLIPPSVAELFQNITVAGGEVGQNTNVFWRCTNIIPTIDQHPNQERVPAHRLHLKFEERPVKYFFLGGINNVPGFDTRRNVGRAFLAKPLDNVTAVFSNSHRVNGTLFANESCEYANCIQSWHCIGCKIPKEEYAPLLATSKYSFMIGGDTPISQRLYDSISFNTLPIIVSDRLWYEGLPFMNLVPWREFVTVIPEKQEDIGQYIEKVTNGFTIAENNRRMKIMQEHADNLSWTSLNSRVVTNILADTYNHCVKFSLDDANQ